MLQPSNVKLTQLERIFEMRTGKQYLESLRDGRKVYVGGEIIEDVTTPPLTKGYANAIAQYYDLHLKQIGRAHVSTPVTHWQLVCRHLLAKSKIRHESTHTHTQ